MILARKMTRTKKHHIYWETFYTVVFFLNICYSYSCVKPFDAPAAAVTNITRQSEKGREEKEGKRVWVWLRNAFLQIGFPGVEGWGVMHCYCAEYFSLLRRGNVRICIKNPNDLTYSQQVSPEIRHASVSRIHNNIWGSMEKNKRQFSKKRGKTEEWIFLAPASNFVYLIRWQKNSSVCRLLLLLLLNPFLFLFISPFVSKGSFKFFNSRGRGSGGNKKSFSICHLVGNGGSEGRRKKKSGRNKQQCLSRKRTLSSFI